MAELAELVKNPSLDVFETFRKVQLVEIAKILEIDVKRDMRKGDIKKLIEEALVEDGLLAEVLQAGSDPRELRLKELKAENEGRRIEVENEKRRIEAETRQMEVEMKRRMLSCGKPQYHPTWPNGPVGASNVFPVHFPSLPGSDNLSSSEHNGGLFIPPTYGSYSPSSHTSCYLMQQSTPGVHACPMVQFFEPGQACFIPYESQYMSIPPWYSSGPAPFNMPCHLMCQSTPTGHAYLTGQFDMEHFFEPGQACFIPYESQYMSIPPWYSSGPAPFNMPCHLMCQSTPTGHAYLTGQFDMEHFFEPGQACFIPYESNYMFIPPGYSSGPAPFNMQHHWNYGSGEQNFPFSSPDDSATDYQTDATEYCLSNYHAEPYLFPETCEAGLAPPHCQEMPACSVEQLDVTAENMHLDNTQNQPAWPNVGASHVSPLHFPSLPGSDCFSSSGHDCGLFIPPTYDSNSPSSHTSCHQMWPSTQEGPPSPMGQFDMEHFFEPGQTCFIPHESHNMFIPLGSNSGQVPFNMHHWNYGSGEQNFPSSSPPDDSATDYQTDATEYCLSNNHAEPYLFPETCEAGLAPPHCQEMPACSVEQLDVTAENMHLDKTQNQPAWPNVGASHVSPLHFPSLPGSDCFSSSGHDCGLFIPPTYDSNSASSHTSCHLMWPSTQEGPPSPMGQAESGQQNLASSGPPDESTSDNLTDASEHCLSNNNIEPYLFTENREAELASPHCQEIPACSVEQLDVTAENMNFDIIKTEDPDQRNIQEEKPSKPLSEKTICQHDGVIVIWEIEMPQPIAEKFIGKEGRYSKFVMQRCGGLVYMSQHPRIQDYMLCNIMGTKQQVQRALDLIRKRVKSLSLKNVYSAPSVTFGDHLNETPRKDQNGVRVFQAKPESS